LVEAVHSAIIELKRRFGSDLKILNAPKFKDRWFEAYPVRLENFGGIGMRFGVERIEVESLTMPTAENPCRAYSFSNGEENPALFSQAISFLAKLPLPTGFCNVDNPPGYYLTKELPLIKAESFAEPAKLMAHFRDPMAELLNWHNKHAAKISQFQPRKDKKLK